MREDKAALTKFAVRFVDQTSTEYTYDYDCANHLDAVAWPTGQDTEHVSDYGYDGTGNLTYLRD